MVETCFTSVSMWIHTQYYKERLMITHWLVKDCFRKQKFPDPSNSFPEGALKEFTFELDPETLNFNLSPICEDIL